MEETANTTELVYAAIAAISASLIGGVISWKLISNKEEQRAKECRCMGKEISWISRIRWYLKLIIGFSIVLMFTYPFLLIEILKDSGNTTIYTCIWTAGISAGLLFTWVWSWQYPLFAIIDETLVVWSYLGYSHPTKYALNELSRENFEDGANHITVLFKEKKRVKKFITNAYKDEKALLELLSQIPEKKES